MSTDNYSADTSPDLPSFPLGTPGIFLHTGYPCLSLHFDQSETLALGIREPASLDFAL